MNLSSEGAGPLHTASSIDNMEFLLRPIASTTSAFELNDTALDY
jgi:hypothetical protein